MSVNRNKKMFPILAAIQNPTMYERKGILKSKSEIQIFGKTYSWRFDCGIIVQPLVMLL